MKFKRHGHGMVFNAEGGGGGGAAAAAPGAAAAPAASAPAAAPPAGSENAAAPSPSVPAVPPAGASSPAPAGAPSLTPYRPEGLAEHLVGKSDNETIDNLKKAVDGYRQRDAEAGVPSDPKQYAEFSADLPEAIKPHVAKLTEDPLFDRVSATAAKLSVTKAQYQGLVTELMSASAEIGILEPPVDHEAEKALLTPDNVKHLPVAEQKAARERRMSENYAFIDMMATKEGQPGGISKDAAEFAKAMLGDTARGHQFFEAIRAIAGSSSNGPTMNLNGAGGAPDPKADISRRAGLPENTWGDPAFNQASYDKLQAERRQLYGD